MKHWNKTQTAWALWRYVVGDSLQEIATQQARTRGAVNSKLHRLRKDNPDLKLLWRRA